MVSGTESTDGGVEPGSSLSGTALVVAVTVIAVWLGLLVWLAFDTDASEVTWSRLLVVLGSVEAVAFAAVGALFGATVQRQRVADLQARADAAESRAEANQTAAINGERLAAAVRVTHTPGTDGGAERLSADARLGADPVLELANRLFPD